MQTSRIDEHIDITVINISHLFHTLVQGTVTKIERDRSRLHMVQQRVHVEIYVQVRVDTSFVNRVIE
jgi:hypothetical protein